MLRSYLGKRVHVKIDRPIGSTHPKHKNIVYSLNYGFIPNTLSPDGEEIDAYVLGESAPVTELDGVVIAIIVRKNDIEQKLVVATDDKKYTLSEIASAVHFQEQYFDTEIIIY